MLLDLARVSVGLYSFFFCSLLFVLKIPLPNVYQYLTILLILGIHVLFLLYEQNMVNFDQLFLLIDYPRSNRMVGSLPGVFFLFCDFRESEEKQKTK